MVLKAFSLKKVHFISFCDKCTGYLPKMLVYEAIEIQ